MATKSDIGDGIWWRDEDQSLQFTVLDSAGAAVNITGWTLTFTLYDRAGTTVHTETSAGGGIALTAPASGILAVTVGATELAAASAGNYYYRLIRTNSGNATVVAYGDVVLR